MLGTRLHFPNLYGRSEQTIRRFELNTRLADYFIPALVGKPLKLRGFQINFANRLNRGANDG